MTGALRGERAGAKSCKVVSKRCHKNGHCCSGFCEPNTRQCVSTCEEGEGICGMLTSCAPGCGCYRRAFGEEKVRLTRPGRPAGVRWPPGLPRQRRRSPRSPLHGEQLLARTRSVSRCARQRAADTMTPENPAPRPICGYVLLTAKRGQAGRGGCPEPKPRPASPSQRGLSAAKAWQTSPALWG